MKTFSNILDYTLKFEGLYSNDPYDFGGETYRGIARRKHPNWPGWIIIDKEKPFRKFPPQIDLLLRPAVEKFYRIRFWDELYGDEVLETNFEIAQELFDTAVNMGIHRAIKFLQQALNLLNRNETLFPDLTEDGILGEKTIMAFKILPKEDFSHLYLWMNIFQGTHYAKMMRNNSTQKRFARGWSKRIQMIKL